MATRNERKRLAKAKHAALVAAVNDAFAIQAAKDAAIAERHALINGVDAWGRPIKGIGLTRTVLAVKAARKAPDYERQKAIDASCDAAKRRYGI
jgi:hypothetical protein